MAKKNDNKIKKFQDIETEKIKVFFKRSILETIMNMLLMEHSGFRSYKTMKNFNRLFNNIDESLYKRSQELTSYIWCIKIITKKWLDGLVNRDLIVESVSRDIEFDNIKKEIIDKHYANTEIVSLPEAQMIFNLVAEALQYGVLSVLKDEYINLLDNISLDHPGSFRELSERLFEISHSLLDIKYNTSFVSSEVTFNSEDETSISNAIGQTIESLSASSNLLKVGIKRWNTLLSPAYMNGRIYTYLGLPGSGKASPDSTLIPVPEGGFKRLDELNLGDKVFDINGKPTKITGIFPQGIQKTYQVKFSDGRIAKCNLDHLWTVILRNHGIEVEKVLSLRDIIKDYRYYSKDGHKHFKYRISKNPCVYYEKKDIILDPWMLGYTIDDKYNEIDNYMFRQFKVNFDLIYSLDRIPYQYIYNSEEIRMKVLQGLLDRNGYISDNNKEYSILYKSKNKSISEDVCILLESLGIEYHIGKHDIIHIKPSYDLYPKLFSKKSKLEEANKIASLLANRYIKNLYIVDIKEIGEDSQRCIMVDDQHHMYLTEHFIPTHNSTLLLKSALDIRKYNPDLKPKTPGMKPVVLYITMENGFTETIERVWNMCFDNDDITNYSVEEASEKLMKELGLGNENQNSSNIGIVIQFHPYRSISTDDLHTLISDLKDDGMEVCALVLDYIKRIRPSIPSPDSVKVELGRVMNELKAIALIYNIILITAHQLNRAGASKVDNAVREGKSDVLKLVGRENVGDAWDVIEVSDFACLIDRQYKAGTNDLYQVFNVIKRRRIDTNAGELAHLTYMAHPFQKGNGLKLVDDLYLDKVLSLQSLANDIDDVIAPTKVNAVKRQKIKLEEFDEGYEDLI